MTTNCRPHCGDVNSLGPVRVSHIHLDNWDPSLHQWPAFQLNKFPPVEPQKLVLFHTPHASDVPACLAASPGQVMTHSQFPEKAKGCNVASGDLIIYGALVYLESLQRKMTKEHELWQVTVSSLLPFTSCMSLGKLTSLSLSFLICKLGIPCLLHSFWRIQ